MSLQEKQVQSGLSFFSCGDKDLDDFFHCDAAEYEHALFGKTYAFVHKKSGEISSMFTISNGSVQARQMRRTLRDKSVLKFYGNNEFSFIFKSEKEERESLQLHENEPLRTRMMCCDLFHYAESLRKSL